MQSGAPVRTVIVFAPADVHSLEIAAVLDTFAEANAQAGRTLYRFTVVAERSEPIRCASGLRIIPDCAIGDAAPDADTLVVAGSCGIPQRTADPVLAWIADRARHARRHGATCTGTFLLGAAGLIDGRHVTTHWRHADELAARYPKAIVDRGRIFVRDGGLFTCAGITAAIDVSLALVEEDHGRALALAIARYFVMSLKRPGGQSQYNVPLAVQAATRSPIARAQQWIAEHPDEALGTEALAALVAMSPRNFSRVFRRETGHSPAEFVEGVRIEAARRLLEETPLSLEEIARASGLGTAASARRTFLRRLGITLKQYRERARLEAQPDSA